MIAIDFGTTNSSIAILSAGETDPRLQRLEYGDQDSYEPKVLPSAVCACRNHECKKQPDSFGHEALRHSFQLQHDSTLLQEMKLYFDKSTTNPPSLVEAGAVTTLRDEGGFLTPVTKIFKQPHYEGEVPLKPAEFVPGTATLIREIVRRSGVAFDDRKEVAIGVPAAFGATGMRQLREAVKRGVLGDGGRADAIHLFHEPVAAARSYYDIDPGNILVLDYGGGTLDISVIPVEANRVFDQKKVHFSGFPEGGSRMDEAILNFALARGGDSLQSWYKGQSVRLKLRIKRNVELAKIALSSKNVARIEFPTAPVPEVEVTPSDLALALSPILARMISKVTQTVIESVGSMAAINFVALSGGTSLNPTVQNTFRALFQHVPENRFILPDASKPADVERCLCAVANGLALLQRDGFPSLQIPG